MKQAHRVPHALLLYGSPGVGKSTFAKLISRSLLCKQPSDNGLACGHCSACQLLAAGTHPDLSVIEPTPSEKSKSKKPVLSIRIETIRDLCDKLVSTSQYEGYRVAVIKEADQMGIAAANALLKTLEEPGANTVIVLVCSNPQRLPVTIRSRCHNLRFPIPIKSEALKWLKSRGVANAEILLNHAHGAPLLAERYAEEQLDNRVLLSKALLASSNGQSSLGFAQELANLPKDKALSWLLDWASDLIKLKQCGTGISLVNEEYRGSLHTLASRVDTLRLYAFYDLVCSYIRQEGIALNPQLLWENLLISWDNI